MAAMLSSAGSPSDLNPSGGFSWSREQEPHAERRREMLEKYPQIKALYGPCARTKYICAALVAVQLGLAYALRNAGWGSCSRFTN
jgi:sphingolipid delta-4 desaturase